MPDLKETRSKVQIALGILVLLDVAAIILYSSPLVGSAQARQAQIHGFWQELQQKTREVTPLRGLDKKIPVARKDIDEFYKNRLPAEDSSIYDNIGKVAAQSGVRIASIKSALKDPEALGVRRVEIEADLAGDYLQLVRFINGLERDPMFFLVDSVQLGGEQGGTVRLQMKMETYLKTGGT